MVFNIGGMPRTARAFVGGMWYHVLNRRNRREPVFHQPGDYDAFVEAMIDAGTRVRVDLLGYCLMPRSSSATTSVLDRLYAVDRCG